MGVRWIAHPNSTNPYSTHDFSEMKILIELIFMVFLITPCIELRAYKQPNMVP